LADGSIEYIGRADFQVKVRGFRIELGEIETVLARHPAVKECVVAARGDSDGPRRLVAYIVPAADQTPNVSSLREFLRETLPEYMVPAVFMVIEAFPLTANNKVDRARLPDPGDERPDLATEHVPPSSTTEITMARIWEEQLGVANVGVNDNFFDLGGDSLMALRMIMQANRAGLSLAPVTIFRYQTIAELANAADEARGRGVEVEPAIGLTPLTPAQRRFLYERETPDVHHWNVSTIVQTDQLSVAALRNAVDAVVRHHDALRLRLRHDGNEWQQEIVAPSSEIPFESHDLTGSSPAEQSARIEEVCAQLQGSLDLAQGPVLRVAHFDGGPDAPDRLFVTIHHFAVDGLTWEVFWEDLEDAYQQVVGGADVSLPPKTTSYREWSIQLEHLARSPRVVGTAETWLRLPWDQVAALPTDRSTDRGRNTNESAAAIEVGLSDADTRRLLGSEVRPEHVILTAIASSLSAWTASPTVLIDVLGHGRDATLEGINLSRTVGFTLSYNPLLLTHPTWTATPDVLREVTTQIETGPEGFTFELLRFLVPDPALRARLDELPRADVLFNFAGVHDDPRTDELWRRSDEPTGSEESPRGLRQYPIAVRATLRPHLHLSVVYSTELHAPETVQARADEFVAAIRDVLERQPESATREDAGVPSS
jgi:non-ribosomal peptide synthase protein (TIGR01720 family)